MGGAYFAVLSADQRTDESADHRCTHCDHARVVSAMMVVVHFVARRRRWRLVVVPRRGRLMMHRCGAGVVPSAMRSREASSSERKAGEGRSEDFHVLVHITPSLSFCFVVL